MRHASVSCRARALLRVAPLVISVWMLQCRPGWSQPIESEVVSAILGQTAAPGIDADDDGAVTVDEALRANAAGAPLAEPLVQPRGAAGDPAVVIGRAAAFPGQTTTFSVTLQTGGHSVAGMQNDITYDRGSIPVITCRVNPSLNKSLFFSLSPGGCPTSPNCMRAIVVSFSNLDAIPNGSELYSCDVAVSAGVTSGEYPLTVSNYILSTAAGQRIPGVVGVDGAIEVGDPATCGNGQLDFGEQCETTDSCCTIHCARVYTGVGCDGGPGAPLELDVSRVYLGLARSDRNNGMLRLAASLPSGSDPSSLMAALLNGSVVVGVTDQDASFAFETTLSQCTFRRFDFECSNSGGNVRAVLKETNDLWEFRLTAQGLSAADTGARQHDSNPLGAPVTATIRAGAIVYEGSLDRCKSAYRRILSCR